jgi:hypothetical protein
MMSPDDPKLPVSPPDSLYRDGTEALRQEAQRLGKRHRIAIDALRKPAEPVFVARYGRVAAGRVMVAGVAALIVAGIAVVLADDHLVGHVWDHGLLTGILLGTWPAAGLAYLLARAWARRRFERRMLAPIDVTADAHADLDRARRFDPGQHAMRMLVAMEAGSMAPLLAGATMLLPLTLHFFAGLVLGADVDSFDSWIAISAVAVGHCHLILGVRAWRHGRRLATVPTVELLYGNHDSGWTTYGIVLASSLFPGVVAMFVPVILVAVTGLFIPLIYRWAARRIAGERDALAMTAFHALSVATAGVTRA